MKFPTSIRKELERQHTTLELQAALSQKENVVYRENGNRRVKSSVFLKAIEKIIPKIGVTRTADISYLADAPSPVFQSCRPNYFFHASLGQNSGAQGKGASRTQAIISCLMETLEGYSCEPRKPDLIRASYNFLVNHKLVCDPRKFITVPDVDAVTLDEALMWAPVYCLGVKEEVLIPAELIFFPFLPMDYETRSLFPSGSSGLSGGSSYLEATVHALYEVIERHCIHFFNHGKVAIEAIYDQELKNKSIAQFSREHGNEYEVQFYAIELPDIKNLPLIFCTIVGQTETFTGWGLSATVDVSIDRAFSETLQNMAVHASGAREDLGFNEGDGENNAGFNQTAQPKKRTLRIGDYKKRVHDKIFKSLNDELTFILKWLEKQGYKNVFVANLTRVGIDVPVVKVVIPGFELPDEFKTSNAVGTKKVLRDLYPNMQILSEISDA